MAFVGGMTFSTSVLQNMCNVSVYRLLLVIDLLAFTLMNLIHLLVKFIFVINDRDLGEFKITYINYLCLFFAAMVIFCWLCSADELPGYLKQFYPWCSKVR